MATRIILQCQRCGQDFSVPPARAAEAKYCSMACYCPPTLVNCKVCGTSFRISPGQAAARQYCSLKCKGEDCRTMGGYRAPAAVRFLDKVDKGPGHGPDGECWQWTGVFDKDGYGRFIVDRKVAKAHRFSYETYIGPVPKGTFVCHTCDNRACVRPEHLWLGDARSNTHDMIAKGRDRYLVGEDAAPAKLTELEARAILADRRPQNIIAAEYGVSRATVCLLKKGKTWKHLYSSPPTE